MVASLLFCFTLWAALAYIPAVQDVVAQSTPTLSEDVTPTATNKAAQTHTVAVGNVSLSHYNVVDAMGCSR